MSTRATCARAIGFLPSVIVHGGVLLLLGALWTFPIAAPEVVSGRTPLGFALATPCSASDPPSPVQIPLEDAAETPAATAALAAIEPQPLLGLLDEAPAPQAALIPIDAIDASGLIACAMPHPRNAHHETATALSASADALAAPAAEPARSALLITRVPPSYPREALRRGWEGEVVVEMTIAPGGEVVAASVRSSSGHDELDHAACAAALRWIFAAQSGQDAALRRAAVAIRFRLDG